MVTGNSDPTQDEYEELAQFARQLERELEALKESHERDIDERNNALSAAHYVNGKLERGLAAMREQHVMELAAISTASIQNTEATVKDRVGADNPYCTVAYLDVCRAIDREMRLIKERDKWRVCAVCEEKLSETL
jgi:hypothetical protein